MGSAQKPVVIVFARAPRLGAVKTRLAAGVGKRAAFRFYVETTGAIIRRLANQPRWEIELCITPENAAGLDRVWPGKFPVTGQGGGNLGRRMERAMMRYPSRPVILIGSDIPDIRVNDIAAGFRALGTHDLVFGPADDGGYWLVGAKHGALARGLFENVRWSGPHALSDTRANANGKRVARLRNLSDIDDVSDYERWRSDATFA